jgi:ribosomal protein S18 acetylase RimI-like enzyme
VLEPARRLSEPALQAIAALERRVVGHDGGRLKLEWGTLRARTGERVEDLLWWEDGRLLGFLGLYEFGGTLELAGMVDPAARRRGIGSALLDAAIRLGAERGLPQALLIVPRASAGGPALAARRGGKPDHSEHALVLTGPPAGEDGPERVGLRAPEPAEVPALEAMLEAGFGNPAHLAGEERVLRETVVVEHAGAMVGTLRIARDDEVPGIYGFVIDPPRQGHGLGRAALRAACRRLHDEGAERVRLEVEVENDRALSLYTSLGFVPVSTEDYYALALA